MPGTTVSPFQVDKLSVRTPIIVHTWSKSLNAIQKSFPEGPSYKTGLQVRLWNLFLTRSRTRCCLARDLSHATKRDWPTDLDKGHRFPMRTYKLSKYSWRLFYYNQDLNSQCDPMHLYWEAGHFQQDWLPCKWTGLQLMLTINFNLVELILHNCYETSRVDAGSGTTNPYKIISLNFMYILI